MSDEQLMLLEQIAYLESDIEEAAGVQMGNYGTLGDMLSAFDDAALDRLQNADTGDFVTGAAMADAIRAIKNDSGLCSLVYKGYNSEVYAHCFQDADGHAIVIFHGTVGGEEWYDNCIGAGVADTKAQEAALQYIEGLDYEAVTVVGHSKGGNKAMYSAILSDKVDRCVSMDGQGFSQEFHDKYKAEIDANSYKIVNKSSSDDFVNTLMIPVGKQEYYEGSPDIGNNHSPLDCLKYDENGHVYIVETQQNEGMKYINGLICYMITNMTEAEKSQVLPYVGTVMAILMDGSYMGYDDVVEFLVTDPDALSILLAYMAEYVEINKISEEELYAIAEAFGWEGFLKTADILITNGSYGINISDIVVGILRGITDGKIDPVLKKFLKDLFAQNGKDASIVLAYIEMIENKSSKIKRSISSRTVAEDVTSGSRQMDFSSNAFFAVAVSCRAISSGYAGSLSNWGNYSGNSWYPETNADGHKANIDGYFKYLQDTVNNNTRKIVDAFEQVASIDSTNASIINGYTDNIRGQTRKIEALLERLGFH